MSNICYYYFTVKALGKNLDISPKKARIVSKIIKGMDVEKALLYLAYIPKKASVLIKKVLQSAVSNAVNNNSEDLKNLYVKNVTVDKGISLKRIMYKGRGRFSFFSRTYSNIKIELGKKNT
ncbi:MAG: 50S ribosomal protein L22 [Candidatus Dojkabacteria bacterium]|nr:50S ribosomal protein L22 [Candidatus Dojkabacteria bacterium]